MEVGIVETTPFELKKPTLIEGLPGIGLVGTIAATYLVDKLRMEPLGYIESEAFPPIAAIHNNVPFHPARVYKSKKHNIVVVLSEFIIPMNAVYPLSRAILKWALSKKVSRIISLGGIALRGQQDDVFGIASTPEMLALMNKAGVKTIREGATTGVNGIMLADCASMKFPALSLLAEAKSEQMDPRGAAMVLESLKKVTGLDLDTTELLHESSSLELKMTNILDKAKASSKQYRRTEEIGSMYE